MTQIATASHQWATRPDDQRFTSLHALGAYVSHQKSISRADAVSSRRLNAVPEQDHKGILLEGPNGHPATMTNWSFGQLASLAGAPAGYLRKLPAELAVDNLNFGLQVAREVEDVGVLLRKNGGVELAAATGPNYGRIWNADIAQMLIERFGDGATGEWRVPGEFRQAVTVDKRNTTIYASDRDMFVFLANEKNMLELPARRDGKPGSVARGFFVWNSEVGAATLGAAFFLYDFVCCNRMIWGARDFREVRIRHTSGAPDRWLEEIHPTLIEYANSSAKPVEDAIRAAREKKLADKVDEFLAQRFGRNIVAKIKATHEAEEGRPIETVWDVTTAVTAMARLIPHQDARIDLERQAGALLDLAA